VQTEHETGHTAPTDVSPIARIGQVFAQAGRNQRSVLIPYFMCGYPSATRSVELALTAAEVGADVIELGIPFSDPLADGVTIQQAGRVALEGGMTVAGCLEVARQVAAHSNVPLILMSYYNPIMSYGIERFCQRAAASGVCGLIVADLPIEEATPLQQAAQRDGLSLIFLVPPTSSDARIGEIAQVAAEGTGSFLYCVSLSGVTGARTTLPPDLPRFIDRVRACSRPYALPLVVGFGLSTPAHIAAVTRFAEGAVVGSALVQLIGESGAGEQVEAIRQYVQRLRAPMGTQELKR
jgi:tryptophan synthase alpha chain